MITTKQRAYLRSLIAPQQPVMQVGKDGLKEESYVQIEELFEARELFKINILKNAEFTAREVATQIMEKTGCEIVQVIGNKACVYRRSTRKDIKNIVLPK